MAENFWVQIFICINGCQYDTKPTNSTLNVKMMNMLLTILSGNKYFSLPFNNFFFNSKYLRCLFRNFEKLSRCISIIWRPKTFQEIKNTLTKNWWRWRFNYSFEKMRLFWTRFLLLTIFEVEIEINIFDNFLFSEPLIIGWFESNLGGYFLKAPFPPPIAILCKTLPSYLQFSCLCKYICWKKGFCE